MDNLKTSQINIEQQAFTIAPYLAAYFDRQDRARRFTQPGFMVRELTSYYHTRQKETLKELAAEAFKLETLKGIEKQIKALMKRARKLRGDELRKVGTQIQLLNRQAEILSGSTD